MMHSVLWRRLDAPGHDVCRLARTDTGWTLDGAAVFLSDAAHARLDYRVSCDRTWHSLHGHVRGWIGTQTIVFSIERRTSGVWTLNGAIVPGLGESVDLDLGFTPATNLFQLRRLDLSEGQHGEAPAAWLDVSAGTLDMLPQRYERRSATSYWYEAPRFAYSALLEVAPTGFVRQYPGLWEED